MDTTNRSQTKKGPGRKHSRVKPDAVRKDKQFSRENGISEPLRRYAAQYGVDSVTVAQVQKQADALIASRA